MTDGTQEIKANNFTRHVELQHLLSDFCENPDNFSGGPRTLYEIADVNKIGYQICSKTLQLMDARRFDPNSKPHEKFSDHVKVWKKGNGIFVWRAPVCPNCNFGKK